MAAPTPPVHPRGCGEHAKDSADDPTMLGSSPRVRGTPQAQTAERARARFIPAGAGNTYGTISPRTARAVHPRGCGEHFFQIGERLTQVGSSPRVRGTPRRIAISDALSRFIPAGAGNTIRARRRPCVQSVHPRGCGEHSRPAKTSRSNSGSSPRVRGTPMANALTDLERRFIPAGAGNTALARNHVRRAPVHPRGCGEHWPRVACVTLWAGSSPRVRGTQPVPRFQTASSRFIPAGAGNTGQTRNSGGRDPVHPRGCGEHLSENAPSDHCDGSSPRVRGTRSAEGENWRLCRFIPAGAGNT